MNIAVIGTGYVGLVTGVCLAEIGHQVTCIDVDDKKISSLKSGTSPIYEDGLEDLLIKNIEKDTVRFTTDYSYGLKDKAVIYIGVGTPQAEDGSADLTYINDVCHSIARNLQRDAIIVTKSTVPVGTNEHIKNKIMENIDYNVSIEIVSNPEFLRQGSAVYDTFHGDRIVIGSENDYALNVIENVNKPFGIPIVKTDLRSAEMIKYAANAFLATKISFINEIANLCDKLDANVENVAKGIGMDKRIGNSFLNAGIGYGGSCFPKDTNALVSIGKNVDYEMSILQSVVEVNNRQKKVIIDKMYKRFGSLSDISVALLGLSFKPNTDDMREAPSIPLSKVLLEKGANIRAYDPVAANNAKKILPDNVFYADNIAEAINKADCAVILTDWEDIKNYPLMKFKEQLNQPIIFDGRNCFDPQEVRKAGIEYYSIGRP
ncbi:UDPglucose 6-dehydrogenase [Salinibacillus kushneri]|uniref:UDP-glucose 6-dehydrogenase n=1 Tax=Salinibacillus kushneri TaxID=237682 RepID=A0A1I0D0E8_9BACI|nr:UDP-glucose/GDP-mannose dehydrogenase family protein [Salinibacillus kushneri]SET25616.1 UDPglucose 6-dehydrogenase [Salinibacillus kushneri]